MKGKTITKILIVISVIILVLGIIEGIDIMNNAENNIPKGDLTIDGSDFSGMVELVGYAGGQLAGVLTIVWSVFLDIVIWCIYGIVLGIINIVKKINNKEKKEM